MVLFADFYPVIVIVADYLFSFHMTFLPIVTFSLSLSFSAQCLCYATWNTNSIVFVASNNSRFPPFPLFIHSSLAAPWQRGTCAHLNSFFGSLLLLHPLHATYPGPLFLSLLLLAKLQLPIWL